MHALWTTLGVLLILTALRDIVHELFHPERRGSISTAVMRGVWDVTKLVGRRVPSAMEHAGPAALIAVASAWTVMIAIGWTLIYWPRLPSGFHAEPGLPAPATHGFFTALYVSLATMAGLGASGITPEPAGLRIITTLEAFVGLVMITAWITWVLSIYPVLANRRAFARRVALLRRAEDSAERTVASTPDDTMASLLRSFTEDVTRVDSELQQAAVTYYFQERSSDATLSAQLPYVLALSRTAQRHDSEAVRYHARLLELSIESLVNALGSRFLGLHDAGCDRVIDALARDHLRTPAAMS